MNKADGWNYIVDHYEKNKSVREEVVQESWVNFFADAELFQYSKIRGEIDSRRSMQIGSTERVIPDIILRKDNEDLAVIELKQYSLPFSEAREAQLYSYLKLLRVSIGVLICDKIYIYAFDFDKEIQERKLVIPFERDNANGIRFMEVFHKDNCSRKAVEAFIKEDIKVKKNVKEIEALLNEVYILNLIKENLKKRDFNDMEINNALKDLAISIKKKKDIQLTLDRVQGKTYYKRNAVNVSNTNNDRYSDMKIGKIVQTVFREILESNRVSEEEISLMQTHEYSKKIFDLQYPLLVSSDVKFDRVRYYKMPVYIHEKSYYICSQWFEKEANNDRPYLLKWIEEH